MIINNHFNPCRDIVFKYLYTLYGAESDEARNLLLSTLIGRKIVGSVVLNNEQDAVNVRENARRLKMKCTDDEGIEFITAIQMAGLDYEIKERQLYYVSDLYSSSVTREKHGLVFYPVYSILICDKTSQSVRLDYLQKIQMKTADCDLVFSGMTLIYLELSKIPDANAFLKELERNSSKDLASIDPVLKWGLFFKSAANPELRPLIEKLAQDDKGIRMSSLLLDRLTEDESAQEQISKYEIILRDYSTDINCAKEQGIEIGKLEGKIQTARLMKEKEFPITQIAELTQLNTAQIEKL